MVDLSRVRQSGPLAPFASGFAATLAADGYLPHGAVKQLHLFVSLSRWLEREGLEPGQLGEEMLGRFFEERRAVGHTKFLSVRAAERLLAYLRELGVVAPRCAPRCEGPVEELLAAYQRYLVLERGLLAESARGYAVNVRPFLEGLSDPDGVRFDRINGAAVVGFVVASCPSQSRSSAKRTTKALRSLLRFLHAEGLIQWPLDHAVPAASGWRLAGLPKRLEPEQIARLLGSCDRSTPVGRRDFAIVMTLARLGLRAGEVAHLSLDDIDWRAGELVVHGKHSRADRLPLPRARRRAGRRAVPDHSRPAAQPRRPRATPVHAKTAARSCPSLAGKKVTPHVLRHSAAMRLLHAGVDTTVIALWLGHEQVDTTQIYLHADLTIKEQALARVGATRWHPRPLPPARQDARIPPSALSRAFGGAQRLTGPQRRRQPPRGSRLILERWLAAVSQAEWKFYL